MPEAMHRYINDRVKESGYGTVSEYFRELVRDDRQRQINRADAANRYTVQPSPAPAYLPLASAARRK